MIDNRHYHVWKIATNQDDTGTSGVRIVCKETAIPHFLTVLKDCVKDYVL